MKEKKERKKYSKNRRIKENGEVWYYYAKKKKLGRKKKRGPKKKKKETWVRRVFPSWDFKIIICGNKKQVKYIGRYHDEMEISEAKENLLNNNKNVIFPVEYKNNSEDNTNIWDLEYIVLKRFTDDDETLVTKLPNKYGKIVEHKTNNDEWIIWDKFPCKIEEDFWVYGYDNKKERKTVAWIYENLIKSNIDGTYNIIRITLYNNKLILQNDDNSIELVICKNMHDSIRLYNILKDKFCEKEKNVIFCGILKLNSEKYKTLLNIIRKKTKWSDKDIYRKGMKH